MSVYPVELKKLPDGHLMIAWSDDEKHSIATRVLRKSCPCASCKVSEGESEKGTTGLNILTPAETLPLEIESMQPVGNYAYNIHFSDGHTTGIFTFDHLRRLGSNG